MCKQEMNRSRGPFTLSVWSGLEAFVVRGPSDTKRSLMTVGGSRGSEPYSSFSVWKSRGVGIFVGRWLLPESDVRKILYVYREGGWAEKEGG